MGYWNGRKLREWREEHGYGQRAVAKKLGVAQSEISYYENDTATPSPEVMDRLTEWTGKDATYFNDNPKPVGNKRPTTNKPEPDKPQNGDSPQWNPDRLLLWRAMNSIPTRKAGEIMGVTSVTVNNYERGKSPIPGHARQAILQASGLPESWFTTTRIEPVGSRAWEPSGALRWYPARLTLWRAHRDETIRQTAKRLTLDPQHLAAMETGAKPITKRVCHKILFESGYPMDWFTSGENVDYPQRRLDTPETGSWPWMQSPLREERREGWYPYRVWCWMDGGGFKPWKATRRLHMSWNRLKRVMDGDEELTPDLKQRILKGTGLREGWFQTPPQEDTPEDWGLLEGGIYDSPSMYAFLLDNPTEMRDAGVRDVAELKRIMKGVTPEYTPGGSFLFPEWEVKPGDKPIPPNCMRKPKKTGKPEEKSPDATHAASDGKPVSEDGVKPVDARPWESGPEADETGDGDVDALALAKRILALRRDAAKLGLDIDVSGKKD